MIRRNIFANAVGGSTSILLNLLITPFLLEILGAEAERSDIASHLHDSVLQTLALIQKRSDDPAQVSRLARRQERELRQWLFGAGSRMSSGAATVAGAVEVIVGDIEDAYGLRVDQVVVGGDGPAGDAEEAVLGTPARSGAVTVRVRGSDTDAVLEVEDTGPGIPPESRARVFEPYFTSKSGGSGLGLAIAARIVQEHGGRLEVGAPGTGTGALLRVVLPRRRD